VPAPDPARKAYSGRRFDPEQKNLFERGRDDAVALPVRVDVGASGGVQIKVHSQARWADSGNWIEFSSATR
jgi:hypothetical protein